MKYGLHCIPLFLVILVLLLSNSASVLGSNYIEQTEESNVLFPPIAYLQYGPAPTSSIILYLTSIQPFGVSQATTIFNPQIPMTPISTTVNRSASILITDSTKLQPAFYSFFTFNKLEQQTIPKISNISVQLAPILNPFEVNQVTQVDIGEFVPLMINEQVQAQMPSFSIPSYLEDGIYLVQLSAYFPDQAVKATYTNNLCLGNCQSAYITLWYESRGLSVPFNITSQSSELRGSNDTISTNVE